MALPFNPSHPCLEPRSEYSVAAGRVLKGNVLIAWLTPLSKVRGELQGYVQVLAIRSGCPLELIGVATSNTDAMLMAIQDHENPNA